MNPSCPNKMKSGTTGWFYHPHYGPTPGTITTFTTKDQPKLKGTDVIVRFINPKNQEPMYFALQAKYFITNNEEKQP